MTLVMPDTDLDQRIMEELAPPCDASDPPCGNAAEWVATLTNTSCGCHFTYLLCTPCKDRLLEDMKDTTLKTWTCAQCGTRWGPATFADDLTLELEKL